MRLFHLTDEERADRFAQLVQKLQLRAWHKSERKRVMTEEKEAIDTIDDEIASMVADLGDEDVERAVAAATDSSGVVTKIRRAK